MLLNKWPPDRVAFFMPAISTWISYLPLHFPTKFIGKKAAGTRRVGLSKPLK